MDQEGMVLASGDDEIGFALEVCQAKIAAGQDLVGKAAAGVEPDLRAIGEEEAGSGTRVRCQCLFL